MNPLANIIPAQYRRYVYLAAAAALFIYGLWQVSAGDVKTFLISLASALVSGLAASNTPASETEVLDKAVDLVKTEPAVVADAVESADAVDTLAAAEDPSRYDTVDQVLEDDDLDLEEHPRGFTGH